MANFGRRPNPVFSPEYAALRQVLVDTRKRAGLSQAALAARLDKAKSHIAMIERGQRRVDALELYRWAKVLGVCPRELFSRISKRLDDLGAAPVPIAPSVRSFLSRAGEGH